MPNRKCCGIFRIINYRQPWQHSGISNPLSGEFSTRVIHEAQKSKRAQDLCSRIHYNTDIFSIFSLRCWPGCLLEWYSRCFFASQVSGEPNLLCYHRLVVVSPRAILDTLCGTVGCVTLMARVLFPHQIFSSETYCTPPFAVTESWCHHGTLVQRRVYCVFPTIKLLLSFWIHFFKIWVLYFRFTLK